SLLIMLLAPLLLLIAILIRIESPGPTLFAHKRLGKNGVPFNCYKFRSMVMNAQELLPQLLEDNPELQEEWNRDFKLKHDPRVTRIGRILRQTSLDEIPQLINVLKGEMSLVGPRPIIAEEMERFGDAARDYMMVSPGMTGLWQVSGRSDIDYQERVLMESWYVRNWSLWLDISLLFRTVGIVLNRKGAY
ncbi:MAG: undecaprenyl-phosphate galactose phosphotransferase WbaP, partial [Syntrophomonadaceae bacterium]|nr:undecaprenyl-phosphate galactose phosphotransferase WbaP [Syntrophomonadaceae bacterium]